MHIYMCVCVCLYVHIYTHGDAYIYIYINIHKTENVAFFPCRLFSCGTSKEGESHLVEWNESEGAIKRTYSGFRKRSLGVVTVVQFDTTRNRFLAAGDEFQIKFWDMDNTNMLAAVDADGGLPVSDAFSFWEKISF